MSAETARVHIPDEWALKARCPVCGGVPLKVQRQEGKPDQMKCERCHSAFEVEDGSSRIWFKSLAPVLAALLSDRWVTMSEVGEAVRSVMTRRASQTQPPMRRAVDPRPPVRRDEVPAGEVPVRRVPAPVAPDSASESSKVEPPETREVDDRLSSFTPPPPEPAKPPEQPASAPQERLNEILMPSTPIAASPRPVAAPSPRPQLTQAEVNHRVSELYKLGNTIEQIRDILLSNTSVTRQQLDEALSSIEPGEHQRRSRQTRTIYYILAGLLVFLLLTAIVGYALRGSLGSSFNLSTLAPNVNIVSTLPPDQVLPQVIPTASILTGDGTGSGPAACPKQAAQAAQTFGGKAESWSTDPGNTSWYLLSAVPVTVRIPSNMRAVIVNGSGGTDYKARTIEGPATVKNAVSIGINCK
jgi:hypothetical protein